MSGGFLVPKRWEGRTSSRPLLAPCSSSLGAVTEDDFERTVSSMQDRLDAMRSMIYELQEVRHKAVAALPGPASSLSPLSPPLSPRPVVDEILISVSGHIVLPPVAGGFR